MRYALTFGLLALIVGGAAAAVPWWASQVVLGWIALGFAMAAVGYAGLGPRALGKRRTGELPLWSWGLNGSFLLFGLASMRLVHVTTRGAPWDEVWPSLILGRRPSRRDTDAWRKLGVVAILDLTAELPVTRARRGEEAYLSLPVLDSTAPTLEQLEVATRWIEVERKRGPVYVHCALGHSRSATVVAAWLIAQGHRGTIDELEAQLRAARPVVWFTSPQKAALEQWRQRHQE
jgi:protein-tyrosine phosphatase